MRYNCKNQIFKNRACAFTLVEVLVSVVLVGFIATITMFSTINSIEVTNKKIIVQSQTFYHALYEAYFKATVTSREYNAAKNDEDALLKAIGGGIRLASLNLDCSELEINKLKPKKCAKTSNGTKVGVLVDNKCSTTVKAYEYLRKEDADKGINERATRTVENSCGYLVYTLKKSKKIFKQDAFVVPLKKSDLG